jgi:hypothetical protein
MVVVDPSLLDDVLAQCVGADVHELDAVEGAAARLRRAAAWGGGAVKRNFIELSARKLHPQTTLRLEGCHETQASRSTKTPSFAMSTLPDSVSSAAQRSSAASP